MKILQINCVYKKGSTGKIVYDIHTSLLKNGFESVVVYGRGANIDEPFIHKSCNEISAKLNNLNSRCTGLMYGGCYFSTKKLISLIKTEKPDIVHLHCINGYFVNIYKLISFLNENNIKTVLTLHAEFMYTANCGYSNKCEKWKNGCGSCPRLRAETKSLFLDRTDDSWEKMNFAFNNMKNLFVVGCSEWITNRAKQSPILKNANFTVIHNGINNSDIFFPHADSRDIINKKYNINNDKKLVLFVTSYFNDVKGSDLFLKLAESMQGLPYQFVVVGVDNTSNTADNIIFAGKVQNQDELAEYYSAADVLVVCSRDDNYPTVCLEAVSCGTQVVAFDVGGVKETIPEHMGLTVKAEDVQAMACAVEKICSAAAPNNSVIEAGRKVISRERMAEEYIDLYKKL